MIGVFDSGHGGLTVLRALARQMPDRRFVYLGDHANAPYGNRTPEEIHRYTVAGVERLFGLGCPLVILACNTASAQALRRLQQTWLPAAYPDRRVLGVLVPMVEAITGVPWMAEVAAGSRAGEPRTVAIFATQHTVSSGAYPTEIAKRAPEVRVVQQACPDLVRLIEADAPVETIRAAIQDYTGRLMDQLDGVPPDAVVLGCTHYPLVTDLFAEALPPGVEILDQPSLTVSSLRAYLERHPEFDLPSRAREQGGVEAFHTTGAAEPITRLATRFFGGEARFHSVGPDPIPAGLEA